MALEGHTVRGHVIRLDPTVKQTRALLRAAGVSRFTYNWALAEWRRQYAVGEKPTAFKLKKQFNAIKREQFPWVYESPRDANSQAFADLGQAFSNFFAACSGKRKGRKVSYPKFKKRGMHDSFYVANDKFAFRRRGRRGVVRLPVIGDVKTFEHLRFQGKIMSGRVFREAAQWFIAVSVQLAVEPKAIKHVHKHGIVGVDLGLKTAVVASHGEFVDAPKPLKAKLKQLRRANRTLARREKGSKNRAKARAKLARVHQRIANIRKDFWHKLTTNLCCENQTAVIEDLSMAFMLRNKKLARAAADVGLGMFKPMMLYKAKALGGQIVVADRLYPSTQRCSRCGNVKTGDERIALSDRTYWCKVCAAVEDRDHNASLNLEQYPGLLGNWDRKVQTPMDDHASIRSARADRASEIDEVGTKRCSDVRTI
jgi:putative transposase